jgi:sec-independent protein translocase protein TatA
MGTFGFGEILFVLLVLMLLFGAKKIPLIARGLGEGIRNFKSGVKDDGDDHTLPSGEDR